MGGNYCLVLFLENALDSLFVIFSLKIMLTSIWSESKSAFFYYSYIDAYTLYKDDPMKFCGVSQIVMELANVINKLFFSS